VSAVRWTLVALLVAWTVLFAGGASIERSEVETHAEPATALSEAAEAEGAHDEEGEAHSEQAAGETESEGERVLGVDLESTPLIVLAVVAGLGLVALAATCFGRLRGVLLAIAAIALVWAILDVREVAPQLDESPDGIAVIAMTVAVLHLAAAAVSGHLARTTGTQTP
jgi:hypothetical protein